MGRRIPLAWKNLTHDWWRLTIAAGGIGFASLLIFMQLGFLNALLESTVQILRIADGQLVLVSSAKYALPAQERFDLRRVIQVEGDPEVRRVAPLYMETVLAVVRVPGQRAYPIRVFAFREEDRQLFKLTGLDEQLPALRRPHAVLVDEASRAKYGFFRQARLADYPGELSGQPVQVVGKFRLGVDFATDGNLLMTAANFARFFPWGAAGGDPLQRVDLAIIQLKPGADAKTVQQRIQKVLPRDVEVWDREELIRREMKFWRTNAPVGYIFLMGVYVGFVVGVIICYQILFADITDHLAEFATLKAMGYTAGYFLQLVLWQATYLSLFGFVPGLVVSWLGYQFLEAITGLTMPMTWSMMVTVLGVTWTMCTVSGLFALRKLATLDPADLF
jgi:putative ABC transport system permease protein